MEKQSTEPHHEWLERYRGYLRFLAQVGLDPRLQAKLDPSDIVQETLLLAYQEIGKFDGRSDGEIAALLRKMLARNLNNLKRDLLRQKRDIRRERSLEEALNRSSIRLDGWLTAQALTPSKVAQRYELIARLSEALARLPDLQRQAVILHHWRGLSLLETSAAIERSAAAAAGLINRGLKRLREELKDLD